MPNLWDIDKLVANQDLLVPGETIPEVFWNAVAMRGPQVWLREKDFGIWQSWTWNQVGEAVLEVGCGLMALGFEPGECVSILSNTTVEWLLTDFGALSAAGVANGIYPTDASAQVHYQCDDSNTVVLFVEDDEQLDKALTVRDQLPRLRHIVIYDMKGLHDVDDPQILSFERLRELGRKYNAEHPDALQLRTQGIDPESLAILVYTSGTTGKPKGAMHSHRVLVSSMRGHQLLFCANESDERMGFLPLCHVGERIGGAYASLYAGAKINFVERPDTVLENIREIAPTVMFSTPRIWEKLYSSVTISVSEAGRVQQLAYAWALAVGKQVAERVLGGRPLPWWLKAKFLTARFLVLDNVCKWIGLNRARVCSTGGAPTSPALIEWFAALGIPVLEVWGMTETAGLASYVPASHLRSGSIGRPTPWTEMRIDPETGEILVRGKVRTMGYWNLPEKTAELIDSDGWLHTGDVGTVDEDGFFKITDRMKDIIITSGGKNVTPSEWENELRFSPYVVDAVVIGDRRPYLTAIILVEQENVEYYAQKHDIPFSNFASLTRAPEIIALIQKEVDKVNAKFARVEQIKNFHLLDIQLTSEDEEVTATMKLKRRIISEKYSKEIEEMYSSK